MRALIQRVTRAQIKGTESHSEVIGGIGPGLVVLVGFEASDGLVAIEQMVQKIRNLRIFSDETGKMNHPGQDVAAQYLLVSQFTLYADCKYGNRPSFEKAAPKLRAKESYEHFVQTFKKVVGEEAVRAGEFGSDLHVELVNDGPVTIWLDSTEIL